MSELFQEHIQRHQRLEELSAKMFAMASVIALHGWYQSSRTLLEAADDAEEAARILLGNASEID
jgi:hypothetical protein